MERRRWKLRQRTQEDEAMTGTVTPGRYKGWLVEFGHPPVPCRGFDWVAVHPRYDAESSRDGLLLEAATKDELIAAIDAWPADVEHPDDSAVDRFAAKMRAKMAASRAKGREGWDDPTRCSPDVLVRLMYAHAEKGDPVDVANFCMMLDHYGASTSVGKAAPNRYTNALGYVQSQCDDAYCDGRQTVELSTKVLAMALASLAAYVPSPVRSSQPQCKLCDDTGYYDHAGFSMDPCRHCATPTA
jgi:hypothetical protein